MLALTGLTAPAQALMGVDYVMMKTYFNHRQSYPRELEIRLKAFAKLRQDMHPAHVFLYTNSEGRINKQYWEADGQPWTLAQAEQIRDHVIASTPSQQQRNGLGLVWHYSDGARVIYRMSGSKVFSILAVDKDFNPGDLGQFPDWFKPRLATP